MNLPSPALLLAGVVLAGLAGRAEADCNISQPALKTFTVQSCKLVDPHRERRLMEFAERYQAGFVESAREEMQERAAEIVDSYRGAVLEVTVEGGSPGRYFYPSKEMNSCEPFEPGARFEALLGSACCDGDSNPPCFLGFSALIVEGSEKLQEP